LAKNHYFSAFFEPLSLYRSLSESTEFVGTTTKEAPLKNRSTRGKFFSKGAASKRRTLYLGLKNLP
jgi:hypothetical protein